MTVGPNTLCFACGRKGHIDRQSPGTAREKLEYLHKMFVETGDVNSGRPQANNVELAFGSEGGIMFGETHCTTVIEKSTSVRPIEKAGAVVNVAKAMEAMDIDEPSALATESEQDV